MDARRFINQYRKFRQIVQEEIGEMDEDATILLFTLYARHLSTKKRQDSNPFNYYKSYMNNSALDKFSENFMNNLFKDFYEPFSGDSDIDPDSEDNDDLPPNF
jgi:hypothetical protein